jgi:asparagine synthase (glutamine-hydrolysing)
MTDKAMDMVGCQGSVKALCCHRRRTLSNRSMTALGLDAQALGLDADFLAAGSLEGLPDCDGDPVAEVSALETRLYLGHMLLRDGDVFGMAHSLEIRVPMLDRRMLDLVLSLPGPDRLPSGRADKHLLRAALAKDGLPESVLAPKRGFMLPLAHWMRTSLASHCQEALETLRGCGLLRPEGVESVWNSFHQAADDSMGSRAWELVVLGTYLRNMSLLYEYL